MRGGKASSRVGGARAHQRGGVDLVDYVTVRVVDGGKLLSIVLMIIFIIIVLGVVLYIIYLIKTDNYAATTIINGSINVSDPGNSIQSNITLPTTTTGSISYSFWAYLTSYVPQGANTEPGLVWIGYSGNPTTTTSPSPAPSAYTTTTILNGSPIVFMDSMTNRMYASFYLTNPNNAQWGANSGNFQLSWLIPSSSNQTGDMRTDSALLINTNINGGNGLPYLTLVIDYVPLQRWIQYTFVINQSTISIYQDGSVYTVRSASDLIYTTPPLNQLNLARPIFNYTPPSNFAVTPTQGNGYNGPQIQKGLQQQNMYLATLQYFNYALNQSDIQGRYNSGPQTSNGWFSWINLGKWKFQWPVTQVSTQSTFNSPNDTSSIISG